MARRTRVDRHVARWRDELDYLDPVHEAVVARLMILSRHLAGTREPRTRTPRSPARRSRSCWPCAGSVRRTPRAPRSSPTTSASAEARSRLGSARWRTPGWSPAPWTRTTAAGCTSGSPRPGGAPSTGTLGSRAGTRRRCLGALPRRPATAGRPVARAGARDRGLVQLGSRPSAVQMQTLLPCASASTQKAGAASSGTRVPPASTAAWSRSSATSRGTTMSRWNRCWTSPVASGAVWNHSVLLRPPGVEDLGPRAVHVVGQHGGPERPAPRRRPGRRGPARAWRPRAALPRRRARRRWRRSAGPGRGRGR